MPKFRCAFESKADYIEIEASTAAGAAEHFVEDAWYKRYAHDDDSFDVDVVSEDGSVHSFTVDVEFQVEAFAFPAGGPKRCKMPARQAPSCQVNGGPADEGPQTD